VARMGAARPSEDGVRRGKVGDGQAKLGCGEAKTECSRPRLSQGAAWL
jgi:hypothetical protein